MIAKIFLVFIIFSAMPVITYSSNSVIVKLYNENFSGETYALSVKQFSVERIQSDEMEYQINESFDLFSRAIDNANSLSSYAVLKTEMDNIIPDNLQKLHTEAENEVFNVLIEKCSLEMNGVTKNEPQITEIKCDDLISSYLKVRCLVDATMLCYSPKL